MRAREDEIDDVGGSSGDDSAKGMEGEREREGGRERGREGEREKKRKRERERGCDNLII